MPVIDGLSRRSIAEVGGAQLRGLLRDGEWSRRRRDTRLNCGVGRERNERRCGVVEIGHLALSGAAMRFGQLRKFRLGLLVSGYVLSLHYPAGYGCPSTVNARPQMS